ncbi:MAG: hypothetical protein COA67_02525 [Lutibacter sp.]|nr:MAG: hypothetical protein COA67_02525 [Lutibacter sp.]
MKKIIILIVFSFLMASCGSTKNTSQNQINNTNTSIGKIKYSGGDGLSLENAIVILNAKSSRDGIPAEYAYIESVLGRKFTDWTPLGQALINEKGKSYDVITVKETSSNDEIKYYFDITDFFGKF